MKYEASQRRSRDRIFAGPVGCDRRLSRPRHPTADFDADPAAALLLRIDPPGTAAEPAALLTLAADALGSPR